jgi:hypothetical protein
LVDPRLASVEYFGPDKVPLEVETYIADQTAGAFAAFFAKTKFALAAML